MALKKEKMTEYGVLVEYWKIEEVLIRPSNDYVFIRVAGYPSERVRRLDVTPVEVLIIKNNILQLPLEGSIISYLYEIVKQDEFFLDAEDLLENMSYCEG